MESEHYPPTVTYPHVLSFVSNNYSRVLHPAFEEDEILLILVGGVLGALAGTVQLVATKYV